MTWKAIGAFLRSLFERDTEKARVAEIDAFGGGMQKPPEPKKKEGV